MDTLIFDLDGTLVDSVPDICASLNRALTTEGLAPVGQDRVKSLIARGAREIIDQVALDCGKEGVNSAALRDLFLVEYSARPIENSLLYPGVLNVLDQFKAAGLAMGLCTNKPEKTTYPVLQAFGLTDYFSTIICGDTLAYKKPDARHVLDVVDQLGGDVAGAIFIGDSEVDINAARNAGLPMVLVSYGYTLAPPDQLEADILIDHFGQLPDALTSINQARKS